MSAPARVLSTAVVHSSKQYILSKGYFYIVLDIIRIREELEILLEIISKIMQVFQNVFVMMKLSTILSFSS